jgi:tripartite-type tricarboxylate transporter receptor subunit TctC
MPYNKSSAIWGTPVAPALLKEPSVIEQLRKVGNEPAPSSPDAFKARVATDIEKWVGVVASANIERI